MRLLGGEGLVTGTVEHFLRAPFRTVYQPLPFSDMLSVVSFVDSRAAHIERIDLIKCCSTLTGLSELTHLWLLPFTS